MQVDTFPLLSVTVSVTVLGPTLAHVNVDGETLMDAMPHASELPLLTWVAEIVTVPEEFKLAVMF